jgi:hypothetical protein
MLGTQVVNITTAVFEDMTPCTLVPPSTLNGVTSHIKIPARYTHHLVDIMTRLLAERSTNRIPIRGNIFIPTQKLPDRLWGPPTLLLNGHLRSFPGIKQPEREVDHSPPTSTKVKNEWSYTSITPIALHGVDSDNYILLTYFHLFVIEIH